MQDTPTPRARVALLGLLLALTPLISACAGGPDRTRVPIETSAMRPHPGMEFWVVDSRACPQEMGSDPWRDLRFFALSPTGLRERSEASRLLAAAATRPVVIVMHGNRYDFHDAADEGLFVASSLADAGALPPNALVVAFHWPSDRVYDSELADLSEKGRRAMVAGYHLARFLSAFPAGSRICLIGHSHGAKAALTALHLLGGGATNSFDHDPDVALPCPPPPLHLRAVVMASACDHQWLDPGGRLDRALPTCEGLLNLYNRHDTILLLYPFTRRGDHHAALGRKGLTLIDHWRLGALDDRVEEHNMQPFLRHQHVFAEAATHPKVAAWIAPYAWVEER